MTGAYEQEGKGGIQDGGLDVEGREKSAFEVDGQSRRGEFYVEGAVKSITKEATMMPLRDLDAQRHGTWVHCVGHIITAVIGSGVLYLPFFTCILGWIGGVIMTLTFGAITWYTSSLLADAMVIDGIRHRSYQSAVEAVFGRTGGIILAIVQYPNLVLTAIAYNITGANSMISFASTYSSFSNSSLCTEVSDVDGVPYCTDTKAWVFSVIFGAAQLFLSQLPNLDSAAWASFIGAAMSFGYSFISLGMSIYEIAANGASDETSVSGYPLNPDNPAYPPISQAQKVFDVFNAFGGIVFAFSFSFILIEISDTLKDSGKGSVWHMKRAVWVAVTIITSFYFLVSVLGYIAYGDKLYAECVYVIDCWVDPNNINKTNVARAANLMVLFHMLPAYQVFSQPVFAAVERTVRHRRGRLASAGKWAFRLTFRSIYVCIVCFVAILLPFFSDFVGLIGALGFWPATVLFPIEMYRRIYNPSKTKVILLEILNFFCFAITICAIIGSVQLIIQDASSYSIF